MQLRGFQLPASSPTSPRPTRSRKDGPRAPNKAPHRLRGRPRHLLLRGRRSGEPTFENVTAVVERFIAELGLERFSIYIQDYGAPIGLRIASRRPERIQAIISQSGNAYVEGFLPAGWDPVRPFWEDPTPENEAVVRAIISAEGTAWQWRHGTRVPEHVDPDLVALDTLGLDRPGNRDAQVKLLYDYRTNVDLYPAFQAYFREHQPPTLVTWGANDEIFGPDGARAYLKDLPDAEVRLLDTGHFALEEEGAFIAERIRAFLGALG
jgi:pimeloyl-ACP methyl ester carboxylesterase